MISATNFSNTSGFSSLPSAFSTNTNNSKNKDLRAEVDSQISNSVEFQILEKNFADYISIKPDEDKTDSETNATYTKPSSNNSSQTLQSSTDTELKMNIETQDTMQFSVEVDGQKVTLSVETLRWMHMDISSSQISRAKESVKKSDPLVLDLQGDGIETSGLQQGVQFDLNADGKKEMMSVPTGDNNMLAWDKNNNGVIDDGSELFGDSNGYKNGFDALKAQDANHDGKIDQTDPIFAQLKLLSFDNNGQQKLTALSSQVSAISLDYQNKSSSLKNTDEIAQTSQFTDKNGNSHLAADLLLNTFSTKYTQSV